MKNITNDFIGSTFPFTDLENNYFPKIEKILVEATTKCNGKCVYCGRPIALKMNPEYMASPDLNPEIFKRFDLKNIKFICFCGAVGDAALYKNLYDALDIIKKGNEECVVEMFTNGEPRNEKWWNILGNKLKYNKYNRVIFCLDGLEESNRKYRGTNFNTIIKHIKAFSDSGAWTHVQCILFKHNENEIDELKKILIEAGADVFFTRLSRCYFDDFESPSCCNYTTLDEYAKELDRDPICALQNRNVIFLDVQGNILPCCFYAGEVIPRGTVNRINVGVYKRVLKDKYNLNLFENELDEILNTSLFKYVRNNYKNDIYCKTKCGVGREDSFEFYKLK